VSIAPLSRQYGSSPFRPCPSASLFFSLLLFSFSGSLIEVDIDTYWAPPSFLSTQFNLKGVVVFIINFSVVASTNQYIIVVVVAVVAIFRPSRCRGFLLLECCRILFVKSFLTGLKGQL